MSLDECSLVIEHSSEMVVTVIIGDESGAFSKLSYELKFDLTKSN